jgi:cytochrome P450
MRIIDIYASGRNIWKHRQISKLNPRAANLITMYNKKEHAKRRRLIGPAFTRRRISQFQDRVKEHINTLISKVSQVGKQANESDAWGPPMDMSEWLRYFTFDAVSDFMFGFNYDLLNSAKHRHIIQDIKDASVRNSVLVYQPLLRVFRADKMIFGKSVRGTRSFWKFIRAAISAQSGINRGDDVFTSLAGANCKSHEGLLSMTEIQSEIGVLVIAGG